MEELERKRRLLRSIHLTILSYITIQCLVFLAFSIPGGFFSEFWPGFFVSSLGFHIFLYSLLRYFIDDFKKETNGELLSRINMANRITLMRISTLPTLLCLVIAAKRYTIRYPLLILVVFIFITDFLDGYVSRKANQVTKVGMMMDSASDYSLLIVLSLVFRYYNLIPLWFLVLVLIRLGIQVVFMASLIVINKRIEPRTTFLGKAAIASIMVVYSVEVLWLIANTLPVAIKNGIELIVAGVILASIGDKIWSFASLCKRRGY
jgi:phosphatidylglycerophosphate synthase